MKASCWLCHSCLSEHYHRLCSLWLAELASERPCSSAALGVLEMDRITPPRQKKLPWSHCGFVLYAPRCKVLHTPISALSRHGTSDI
jgi:hypothetical protein